MWKEGFLCAASENTFSTRCSFDVALQIPWYSWQQAPSLGMELRKLNAAICYCWCLFFNCPVISSVEWSRLLPAPLTSLLDSVSVGPSRLGRVRALLEDTAHPISLPNM